MRQLPIGSSHLCVFLRVIDIPIDLILNIPGLAFIQNFLIVFLLQNLLVYKLYLMDQLFNFPIHKVNVLNQFFFLFPSIKFFQLNQSF